MSITVKWWKNNREEVVEELKVKEPALFEYTFSEIYNPDINSHCMKFDGYTTLYMTGYDIRILRALWLMGFETEALDRLLTIFEKYHSLVIQFKGA